MLGRMVVVLLLVLVLVLAAGAGLTDTWQLPFHHSVTRALPEIVTSELVEQV